MKPGPLLTALLTLPAAVFGWIARTRGRLYNSETLPSIDTGVPVVSIGNLTAGGTGKTPIVAYLVEKTFSNLRRAIVSRGYGGSERGPVLVDSENPAAIRFGDEPSWFARKFKDVPVVIGAKRPASVAYLLARGFKPQVVVADDAFQHRRLKRDFDIVILDATEPRWHYQPLPLGRMREDFAALERADAVFISKTTEASRENVDWLKSQVRAVEAELPIIEWGLSMEGFRRLNDGVQTGSLENARTLAGRPVILVSGIGRPENFEKMMRETCGAQIKKHLIYKDHHRYGADDFRAIETEVANQRAEAIVVTEKDAVKLAEWRPAVPVFVSVLQAFPVQPHGALDALFSRLL